MTRKGDSDVDPRGLIREAYRIDGIGAADCRTIFFDWALGSDGPADQTAIRTLFERYGAEAPDHPMTAILREGLELADRPPRPRRAGHRRRRNDGPD
jgi:hypothetical protein